jgi:phage terminase large subunit-like protein
VATLAEPTLKEQARRIAAQYEELERFVGAPDVDLSKLPPEKQEAARQILKEIERVVAANPLNAFKPHEPSPTDGKREQLAFLAAITKVVLALCGNQSGKTTIGIVKALIQVLPRELVPGHLVPFKQFEAPSHGWILCPTEDKIFDSLKPTIEKWCPKQALKGGNWGKAFNGERMQLTFASGSTITFKTYKQDPSTLTSATIDWVLYDEPPPQGHRDECITRLLQSDGPEWFTMTPLKSNVGWIRRVLWRNREDPNITICKWAMRDNPKLPRQAIERILAAYKNDIWRQAREFGDFMDAAGLIYAEMESRVIPARGADFVRTLEHVWAIDPGIRNAAVVAGGFDQHGTDWIYDELLIQDGTPSAYVAGIDRMLSAWGLTRQDVLFVIDPAARQRSQATGDTVQSELTRLGLFTMNGNRDREAGQQQIRDRLKHKRLFVFESCLGLRDEADEFAWEMDDDETIGPGDDSTFHRLATLRYQCMARPWYPQMEARAAERNLGWRPGRALKGHEIHGPPGPAPPMGALS